MRSPEVESLLFEVVIHAVEEGGFEGFFKDQGWLNWGLWIRMPDHAVGSGGVGVVTGGDEREELDRCDRLGRLSSGHVAPLAAAPTPLW